MASLAGLALVTLFMLAYYKLSGINAIVAMAINLLVLLALMVYFQATMTLPGIAGFILTIGMGVDSNVLIFERIKEELAAGQERAGGRRGRVRPRVPHDPRHARGQPHRRRVPVPVRHRPDSRLRDDADHRPADQRVHVRVRLADALRAALVAPAGARSASRAAALMQIFTNANFDFIRWRWHAIALSLVVVLAGLGVVLAKGMPLGIDFTGGTLVIVKFSQPVTEDAVRSALGVAARREGRAAVRRRLRRTRLMIRLPQTPAASKGSASSRARSDIQAALDKADCGKYEVIGREFVGPIIGADLQRKGIYATLLSILGITAYIAVRFRFSFALGAIAATFHDIFVVFALLAFFGYELSLTVVAAILTITGYSVNDTIVIFDRVRENSRLLRREPLEKVVNLSVNQTLGRTIITAGTTFLSVLALYLFGGEVLQGFAFAMLVGIISGTYSTIFIAAAIAIILSGRKAPAGRAAVPVEEAVAERPRKGGRNVRVS